MDRNLDAAAERQSARRCDHGLGRIFEHHVGVLEGAGGEVQVVQRSIKTGRLHYGEIVVWEANAPVSDTDLIAVEHAGTVAALAILKSRAVSEVELRFRNDFLNAFGKVDAILTPTSPTTAFKIGEKSDDPLQMYLMDIFTISCNLAGICGLSVPCGFSTSPRLPIGLQLLGKPFGEETILRIAHAYEQATEWHKARPKL